MTPPLPDAADVVIVGAGVMGASIAFQIAKTDPSKRVLVLDQHRVLGGMSGRTFGQIRLHYSNELTLQMARFGVDYVQNWDQEVGVGASGYVPFGYLLIVTEKDLAACERNVDLARGLGIDTRCVDRAGIEALEPAINTVGLAGGAWEPSGGYIDITRMTLGWFEAARALGDVAVHSGIRVEGLDVTAGAVTAVETNAGTVAAEQVVVAVGPWSRALLQTAGVEAPIDAYRLDTMYCRVPDGARQVQRCVTDCQSNFVVRPDMGPVMLAAAYPGTMEQVSEPLVEPTPESEAAHLARIRSACAERFPGLSEVAPLRSVSGSYDITPDWHPVLGSVEEVSGLHLAAGFSGHGLKLSPAVGQVIAAEILGQAPAFDIHPFRLSRFAENEPMFLAYGPGGRA